MTRTIGNAADLVPRLPIARGKEHAYQGRHGENVDNAMTEADTFRNLLVRARGEHGPSDRHQKDESEIFDVAPKRQLDFDNVSKSHLVRSHNELNAVEASNGQPIDTVRSDVGNATTIEELADVEGDVPEHDQQARDTDPSDRHRTIDINQADGTVASMIDTEVAGHAGIMSRALPAAPAATVAGPSAVLGKLGSATRPDIETKGRQQTAEMVQAHAPSLQAPAVHSVVRSTAALTVASAVELPHRVAVDGLTTETAGSFAPRSANLNPLNLERPTPHASVPDGHLSDALPKSENTAAVPNALRVQRVVTDHAGQFSKSELDATLDQWSLEPGEKLGAMVTDAKQEVHFAAECVANVSTTGASRQIVSGLAALSNPHTTTHADFKLTSGMGFATTSPTPLKILQIQLQPKELGEVAVRIALRGEKVELRVQTARPATADLLKADQKFLVEALQRENFDIDSVTIQLIELERNPGNQTSTSTNAGQSKLTHGEPHQTGSQGGSSQQQGNRQEAEGQPEMDRGQRSYDKDTTETIGGGKEIIL